MSIGYEENALACIRDIERSIAMVCNELSKENNKNLDIVNTLAMSIVASAVGVVSGQPALTGLNVGMKVDSIDRAVDALGDMIGVANDFLSLLETMEPEDTGRNIEQIEDTVKRASKAYDEIH